MPKLEIIIPHYKEDPALMQPMFDILKLQRNVKWTDFSVLIINDGEDITLPEGFGSDCPFEVRSINVPHGGISAARNAGLRYSKGEWIMFCDSDDALATTFSLQTYFKFMTDDKVFVTSAFFEEAPSLDDRSRIVLIWHDGHDYIFVHGKVFRRQWLIDNNVSFRDDLQLHEDTYFIAIAKSLMDEKNTVFIRDALYLWQYNKKSVSRSYDNFVLETYDQLIKKNIALTEEFLRRGMFVRAKGIVCRTITDSYCRCNCKQWNLPDNKELLQDAEDCAALFLKKYDYIYKAAGDVVINAGLNDFKNRLIKEDNFDEASAPTLEEWVDMLRK